MHEKEITDELESLFPAPQRRQQKQPRIHPKAAEDLKSQAPGTSAKASRAPPSFKIDLANSTGASPVPARYRPFGIEAKQGRFLSVSMNIIGTSWVDTQTIRNSRGTTTSLAFENRSLGNTAEEVMTSLGTTSSPTSLGAPCV
jgi:hypothetical protein